MQEKIEELLMRYEELSHSLSQPEIIAQTELWQKLAKEYASLEEAAAAGQEYIKLLDACAHAEEMLSDPEYAKKVTASIPVGFYGTPDDCAGTVSLLCSDEGRYITGQSIYVDGGKSVQ